MSVKSISRLGDWIPRQTVRAWNRTGATLNKGDVVAVDLTGSDGDVNTWAAQMAETSPEQSEHPLCNVIAVASAHLNGWIFLCAQETIANDEEGLFLLKGETDVEIVAGNGSVATVASGGIATPTNGQTYLSAGTDGQVNVAILLESGPTAAAAAVAHALFDGWQFNTTGG